MLVAILPRCSCALQRDSRIRSGMAGWTLKSQLKGRQEKLVILDFFGSSNPHPNLGVPAQRFLTAYPTPEDRPQRFLGYGVDPRWARRASHSGADPAVALFRGLTNRSLFADEASSWHERTAEWYRRKPGAVPRWKRARSRLAWVRKGAFASSVGLHRRSTLAWFL